MATASGEQIIARARVIATQIGVDANSSVSIDTKGGLRALLNSAIRLLYRDRANDVKFRTDICADNNVTVTSGTGTVPNLLMREFLEQANISNSEGDLISFMQYPIDVTSGQTFGQLGYMWITGDTLHYQAPSPTLTAYSGTLTISCPTFPTFPADLADPITFPSESVIDDLCYLLARGVRGDVSLLTPNGNGEHVGS